MNPSKPRPWDFWSAETSLTGLLIFTLAYLFFICALGDFNFGAVVGCLLFSFIIVTGVMTTFRQRWLNFLVIVIVLANLSLGCLEFLHREWNLTILNATVGLLILTLLLATLMVQVFREGKGDGPPDSRRHRGVFAFGGDVVFYLLYRGHDHSGW